MGATILVVEDNPSNLELMTFLLSVHGHKVTSTTEGEQVLAVARAELPDLVVMDIKLAGRMDGYDALRLIRSDPQLASLPVVAVTAYAMERDHAKAMEAGFNGFLAKPIDAFTFATDIERLLPPELHGGRPPRPSGRGTTAAPRPDTGRPPAQGPTVLVVDDIPANIELFRTLLQSRGYRVRTAQNIEEALASAHADHPALIVSDMDMGDELGIDLVQTLRNSPEFADTVVVLTTASTQSIDLAEDLDIPVITRPIEPEALLRRLAELLPATTRE